MLGNVNQLTLRCEMRFN